YKGNEIKNYVVNELRLDGVLDVDMASGSVRGTHGLDWRIKLVDTGASTQTGGRLLRLESCLKGEEAFLLTYGDGLANVNLDELVQFHRHHGKVATVTAVRPPSTFGHIEFRNGQVQRLIEKPEHADFWINGGFFVLNRTIFDYLSGDDC